MSTARGVPIATHIDVTRRVIALRAAGVAAHMAEPEARRQLGLTATSLHAPDPASLTTADEDAHVDAGDRLMRALGFEVVRLSQKRASKITPGVPDRRYYHRRRRLALWWEAKTTTGQQRPAQRAFQAMCDDVGDLYVLGPLAALTQWLVDHGVATPVGAQLEPTPIAAHSPPEIATDA